MDRREILNELAQIVALTDPALRYQLSDEPAPGEAAHRVKSLIREVESWPTAFPPAPFVSDQCAAHRHSDCPFERAGLPSGGALNGDGIRSESNRRRKPRTCSPYLPICKCACHCPQEAPQQPAEEGTMLDETRRQPTLRAEALQQPAHTMLSLIECSCGYRNSPSFVRCHVEAANARKTVQEPPTSPQQPAEPAPATERHIDTPGELLELLAGISSDPQIEGLSLSQKASTMALLYAAKALQQIADSQGHFDSGEIADAILIACGNLHEDSPQEPS